MYEITVPVINGLVKRMGREAILSELKRMEAKRVLLGTGTYQYLPQKREKMLEDLKDNCAYFKQHGFEVGAWNWTFWITGEAPFTHMKSLDGYTHPTFYCPTDEQFRSYAGKYLADIAETGVDMILFDDDFRYGFLHGMNCTCHRHMKMIEELTGEALSPDDFRQKALSGGQNKYRDAYLKVNGDSLKLFAREMREAVDRINPQIRIGLCSCMSLWDTDGVDSVTVSRILAGDTKPFLRLIGAPYWAGNKQWGNRLQNIIELIRMERSWCDDSLEIIAEGDTYPRPRHQTPASYLELYDIALRADGALDGILKYTLDYYASPRYETTYVDRHCQNQKLYRQVEELFSEKEACGVRIYESMNKFAAMTIPKEMEGSTKTENHFFSVAARMLSDNSIPGTYYGEGVCGIAFGENIKIVPRKAFQKGIIIDAEAARILEEQGVDTGLASLGKTVYVVEEYFKEQVEYVIGTYNAHLTELKKGAKADSFLCYTDENETMQQAPASYYYENKNGDKFFVFTFDAYFNSETMYRSYARSKQLSEVIKNLTGSLLPAYSYGNPDLYLMCKEKDGATAAGLWNLFADEISKPVITLNQPYKEIHFLNCDGVLEGNTVTLSSMAPFSFAAFELK